MIWLVRHLIFEDMMDYSLGLGAYCFVSITPWLPCEEIVFYTIVAYFRACNRREEYNELRCVSGDCRCDIDDDEPEKQ